MTDRPGRGAPDLPDRWREAPQAHAGDGDHATPRELVDRSRARAWALQIHYRWESGAGAGGLRDALLETAGNRRISPRRLPRIRELLTALDEHLEEVDAALEDALANWRLERLSSIDRGILRLAAAEILHMPEIPPKASILEAVRLAEAYGGAESPRFVNGVLDAVYKGERSRGGG